MRLTGEVRVSGPMFDGRAVRAVREFVDEAPYEIAGEGVEVWLGVYRPQVKRPTPYYEYLVHRQKVEYGVSRVWDGGEVAYGPWLESTGSRNFPVTSFRGYKSMEKSTPKLQDKAVAIATRLLRRVFLRRMN